MIARVWHGWTVPGDADTYESLLNHEVFAGILARGIDGLRRLRLLGRATEAEVEFVTIMEFDCLDAVRQFAGDDYEAALVPPQARAVLSRFDARSRHYEIRHVTP